MIKLARCAAAMILGVIPADMEPQLLFTGQTFHAGEISASSPSRWLGLFPSGTGFELLLTEIAVSLVNDPIVDEEDEATGRLVMASHTTPPVVLFPLELHLHEGAVEHAVGDRSVEPGQEHVIEFHQRRYVIAAPLVAGQEGRCDLALHAGGEAQVLARLEQCDADSYPYLLWSGDLDRDGELDVLLDASGHYNVSDIGLYLSGAAQPGELVRRVAHLRTVGC